MRALAFVAFAACGATARPVGSPPPPPPTPGGGDASPVAAPAPALPPPLDTLPAIDDAAATSLWTLVGAPVAKLGMGTFEALAIRPQTRWGQLAISWSMADKTASDALMTARRGPYTPAIDHAVVVSRGADAHIVVVTGGSDPRGVPQMVAATAVRALPIDAAAMLDDAAARWRTYLPTQDAAIEAALQEGNRLTGGPAYGAEHTESIDRFAPSWLPATRELEVIYVRRVRRVSSRSEITGGGGCNKYRGRGGRGAGLASFPEPTPVRVACPPPRTRKLTYVRSYAVDVGLVVRYRADGTLVTARPYAPQRVPGQLETTGEDGDF